MQHAPHHMAEAGGLTQPAAQPTLHARGRASSTSHSTQRWPAARACSAAQRSAAISRLPRTVALVGRTSHVACRLLLSQRERAANEGEEEMRAREERMSKKEGEMRCLESVLLAREKKVHAACA